MTKIYRIPTGQVEGNGSNVDDISEIRPYGEIAFYIGDNNKLELLMFDGVHTHVKSKVLSKGTFYGGDADSSDGLNYDTIKLVPEEVLRRGGSDQYVIIEPTGGEPGHVHIRAGGTIDQSSADLFLGGEQQNVRVSDTNDRVTITTDFQNTWTFNGSGNLILPGSSNCMIGEDEPGLVVFSDTGFAILTNAATTSSQSWIFDNLGSLRLPGGAIIEDTATVLTYGTIITVSLNAALDTEDYVSGFSKLEVTPDANTYQVQAGWIITFSNGQQRTVTSISDNGGYLTIFYDGVNPELGSSTYPLTIQSADYNAGSNGDITISLTNINNSTTSFVVSADGSATFPSNLKVVDLGVYSNGLVVGSMLQQKGTGLLQVVSTGTGSSTTIGWTDQEAGSIELTTLTLDIAGATIMTGNVTSGTNSWTFGTDGILTFPNSSLVDTSDSNIEFRGMSNFNVEAVGVVNIVTDSLGAARNWMFGANGFLTFPDGTIQNTAFVIETAPLSSTSTGTAGTLAYDASYFYVCTATNSWQRIGWDVTPW
jgi:hypothetical protein